MDRKKKDIIELTRISRDDYRALGKLPLLVLADNVRSAQNIGSILRTADAFLLKEMIMAGISATPPSNEISKTALGAEESVAWRYVEDAFEEAKRLKSKGALIYVLEQTHGSIPLQKLKLPHSLQRNVKNGAAPNEILSNDDISDDDISNKNISNKDLSKEIVLVVGNEVKGVDQRIVDIADEALEIPMHGIKHSLNVSVSAGIALWQFYQLLKV